MKSYTEQKTVSKHFTKKGADAACSAKRMTQTQQGRSVGWAALHYYVQKGRGLRRYHVKEASR
jgi:hypothetical protein